MKIADTIPAVGTVFDWDIDEIMSRPSADLLSGWYSDYEECIHCGETYNDGWATGSVDKTVVCEGECETAPYSLEWRWTAMMEEKREDDSYYDLLEVLPVEGFTVPLTAYVRDGMLILCDGHHRLAAAQDMGLSTVPVVVKEKWAVANDSGSWRRGLEAVSA